MRRAVQSKSRAGRGRCRWFPGMVIGAVAVCGASTWRLVAVSGLRPAAAQVGDGGRLRPPPLLLSGAEARNGLDVRLEHLQQRAQAAQRAAVPPGGLRVPAESRPAAPPRVPPTPPLDVLERADAGLEGRP